MAQEVAPREKLATFQFRMIYKFDERFCETVFTNEDPIAKSSEAEIRKVFIMWARLSTHQNVPNSSLKRKISRALHGNDVAQTWLRSRLAAFFVRHHCAEGRSNTLVIEDLHGERLETYAKDLGDTSDKWSARKLGVLTFTTPARVTPV